MRGGWGDNDVTSTQSYHKNRQPKSKRGRRPVGNKGERKVRSVHWWVAWFCFGVLGGEK